jgi:hypothetical protein
MCLASGAKSSQSCPCGVFRLETLVGTTSGAVHDVGGVHYNLRCVRERSARDGEKANARGGAVGGKRSSVLNGSAAVFVARRPTAVGRGASKSRAQATEVNTGTEMIPESLTLCVYVVV